MNSTQILYIVDKNLSQFDEQHRNTYLDAMIAFLQFDMRTIPIEETDDLTDRLRFYELKEALALLEHKKCGLSIKKKSFSKLNKLDSSGEEVFSDERNER